MKIAWTQKAADDVVRLHAFLEPLNPDAAARIARSLVNAPKRLLVHPRIGERLSEFDPREVRRILVGDYEMRYEIGERTINILRIWHSRENR